MDNGDPFPIACCMICLVADALKDCKACQFRIGLQYKEWLAFLSLFNMDKMKGVTNDI